MGGGPALSLTGYGEDQMSFSHTAGVKAWLLGIGLKDLNFTFTRNDHMDTLRMEGCHGDGSVSHGACRHGRKNTTAWVRNLEVQEAGFTSGTSSDCGKQE